MRQRMRQMMKTKSTVLVVAAAGMWSLALAGSAGAASFTIASDTGFSGTGVSGTLLAVSSADLGSAICPAGSCDTGSQDFLLFQVDVASGGLDALRVSFAPPPFPPPTWDGAGYVDGAGADPAVSFTTTSQSQALFEWTSLDGASDVLFASVGFGDLAPGVGITFAFTPSGAGQSFNVETVLVIPEPTTAMLFGLGVIGLAATRRRTSHSSH